MGAWVEREAGLALSSPARVLFLSPAQVTACFMYVGFIYTTRCGFWYEVGWSQKLHPPPLFRSDPLFSTSPHVRNKEKKISCSLLKLASYK